MYLDAFHDRHKEVIHIVERVDGKRVFKELTPFYSFYYEDPNGKHMSTFGDYMAKVTCTRNNEFKKELSLVSSRKTCEADVPVLFKTLERYYPNAKEPDLHIGFLDIEVGFSKERGYAETDDPHQPVTAISVYMSHLDKLVTLVLKPDKLKTAEAEEIASSFEDTILFIEEKELLSAFLDLIDDIDLFTGWNSTLYDLPYLVNRISLVLDKKSTSRLCLWNQNPRKRTFIKFEKEYFTFDLVGRCHLDYMDLYKKHVTQKQHSYKLDNIADVELSERKVQYDGTLDQLYNNDFRKFIEYNRQDTMIVAKLDKKKKFINLSNQLAHKCGVLIADTMGSVRIIDNAVVLRAHKDNRVYPTRAITEEEVDDRDISIEDEEEFEFEDKAAGAYVAEPKLGLHKWLGVLDVKSLYPNAIRSLNMAPETMIGQVRSTFTDALLRVKLTKQKSKTKSVSQAWNDMLSTQEYSMIMNKDISQSLVVDFVDGSTAEMTGAELYDLIFNQGNPWNLSANGTIFRSDKRGIIPSLISDWFSERLDMQSKAATFREQAETDDTNRKQLIDDADYWDMQALLRKILLNSVYGALLNEGCRNYDIRLGQSVTLTGRTICGYMNGRVNEVFTGVDDKIGDVIVYSDTDSCNFSPYEFMMKSGVEFEWTKENFVALCETVAAEVNSTWPAFMAKAFNCPRSTINAGLELVATSALFTSKKRYGILYYWKEGLRVDKNGPGKYKIMGLEIKRSDTPKPIQEFLENVIHKVLNFDSETQVLEYVRDFRKEFKKWPAWYKGSPKSVNKLTFYSERHEQNIKISTPGHVRAAINWNRLRRMNNDNVAIPIVDGQKITVCKLKNNPMNITSVAYPVDETKIPDWFKELPFDEELMAETLIDKKIDKLLGPMKWNLQDSKAEMSSLFSW